MHRFVFHVCIVLFLSFGIACGSSDSSEDATGVATFEVPLESLSVSQGTLSPVFSSAVHTYNVTVSYFVTTIDITASASAGRLISIKGGDATSGVPKTVDLGEGLNIITVLVKEGVNEGRYSVVVTRAKLTEFAQRAYAKASISGAGMTDPDDAFGSAVAVTYDRMVVGAPTEDSDYMGVHMGEDSMGTDGSATDDTGAVYVFKRQSDDTWKQEAYLKAANTDNGDNFGATVAISGETIVVGAPGEDGEVGTIVNGPGVVGGNAAPNSGAVYIFKFDGSNWAQQAYVKPDNTEAGDQFAGSLSISGDIVVVGAVKEDSDAAGVTNGATSTGSDSGYNNSGAAYVFERSGGNWAQTAYLKADNREQDAEFGTGVAVDGSTIVVGAPFEDHDYFGVATAASGTDNPSFDNSGAAYVYFRSGGAWVQQAYFKAANTGANDEFGRRVAISGETIVVAAPLEDSNYKGPLKGAGAAGIDDGNFNDSGAAYVFLRAGSTWQQQAYVKAENAGTNDQFGGALAIWGEAMIIGAVFEDSNGQGVDRGNAPTGSDGGTTNDSGAAYFWLRNTTDAWVLRAYLKPPVNQANDFFGRAVAISLDNLLVGGDGEDSNATGVQNGGGAGGTDDAAHDQSGAAFLYSSVVVPDSTPPVFAGLTTATAIGENSVQLTWAAATDNETPVTNITYEIYMSTSSGGQNFAAPDQTVTGVTSYLFGGLTDSTAYYFVVRARDVLNNIETNVVEQTDTTSSPDVTLPTFAGLTLATAVSDVQIDLNWTSATDDVTPAANITYLIYQATSSGAQVFATPSYTVTGTTSYSVPGLTASTAYYYVVRARDLSLNVETNVVEQTATTTGPDLLDPTFAGLVSATTVNEFQIDLSWAAATDNVTPPPSIDYLIYQAGSTGAQNFTTPSYVVTGATSYSVTGLGSATSYFFVVRARDASSNTETNVIEQTDTTLGPDVTAPVFAGLAGAAPNTTTAIGLRWAAATDDRDAQSAIVYDICYSTTSGSCDASFITAQPSAPGSVNSVVSGLTAGTKYFFLVRARDVAGNQDMNKDEMYAYPDYSVQDAYNTTFTAMPTARMWLAADSIGSKIYVAGGYESGASSALAHEFDPGADTWTPITILTTPQSRHRATAHSGKVFFSGGTVAGMEILTPPGTWASDSDPAGDHQFGAVERLGRYIYIVDGSTTPANQLFEFDPSNNSLPNCGGTCPTVPSSLKCRASAVYDGRLYVFGGENSGGNPQSDSHRYDPVLNSWSTIAPIGGGTPAARACAVAETLGRHIYVFGGYSTSGASTQAEVYRYDPNFDTWWAVTSLGSPVEGAASARVGDRIYIIGGANVGTPLDTTHEYR